MAENEEIYPKNLLEYIQSISNRRARIVIDHILKHGFITTKDLEKTYGYNHPPRAARDVREAGIPLETFKIKSQDGKSIAAYKFGDLTQLRTNKFTGRISFSKVFKKTLYEKYNGQCRICNGKFEARYLQVDHRIPYEIGEDFADRELTHFMLLCGSCNRAKSWSCEHCDNWKTRKIPAVCMECYWGNPENYEHIAMKNVRRLDLQWDGDEVKNYDRIKAMAEQHKMKLPDFVKQILAANKP